MRRATWFLSSCLALAVLGPLSPALTAASAGIAATPSRPIVWVSGQDSGQVFITQGTTILKEFNFVTGLNAPILPGVGGPTPGLTVASPKPHLIEFSPDGRFAYVSFQNTSPGKVAVIDVATRTVQTIITIPNDPTLPAGTSPRVTQAKPSPDGTFLIVTEIGPPGVLTRVNVNEANLTWTVVKQVLVPQPIAGLSAGPACTSFSPDGSTAYVDSSLSPFLGVLVVNPSTLASSLLFQTAGDPQCGIHNAFDLNGTRVIVVTDNGAAPVSPAVRQGHVHVINAVTGTFSEPAPSPIPAANLHDNWPVGLQPAGATTTDPANTVYATDRDNTGLHQIELGAPFGAPSDSTLLLADPNVLVPDSTGCGNPQPNSTCTNPRGAPDTLDGSGNTVFVAMKEAGDLGIIDNFSTQTYLHLVTPDPSCGQIGNANFHKCFAVHAVTVQPSTTALSCALGTSTTGGALDVCTLSDPDGIHSFQVKNTATNAQQTSLTFDCATAPTTVQFKVPANTKYKVFVTDCKVPANKTTFVIRANGGVNTV